MTWASTGRQRMQIRVCSSCGASGLSATECNQTGCSECGSTTHKKRPRVCEHNCTNRQGTLGPKGHNRNDCPRIQTAICHECGESGHSTNKCPIRPCNACGLRSHKLQTSHLCPEHVCTLCTGEENSQKVTTQHYVPHVLSAKHARFSATWPKIALTNCLGVDVDWWNLLFTKCESIVDAS